MANFHRASTCLLLFFWACGSDSHVQSIQLAGRHLYPRFEVTNHLLLTDSSVVFSANDSIHFKLYEYKFADCSYAPLNTSERDTFAPFLLAGKVSALSDDHGNEFFTCITPQDSIFQRKAIEKVFTFNNGNLIICKYAGEEVIQLTDLPRRSTKTFPVTGPVKSVVYSENAETLVVNANAQLMSINLETDDVTFLTKESDGQNVNPFIHGNHVYYASNVGSEFFYITRQDLAAPGNAVTLLTADHDLRMPKVRREYLYFIRVINGEYLLTSLNLRTCETTQINEAGVVYNYELLDSDSVLMVYSDLNQPKTLCIYNGSDRVMAKLIDTSVYHQALASVLRVPGSQTLGHVISPPAFVKTVGIVLFIHPGLHADFSPRWDPMLVSLAQSGYVVVAPNYPMSVGYGKSHYNANIVEALKDLENWTAYLNKHHSLPLYYLTASSGNILMEQLVLNPNSAVKAAVSLFGIPLTAGRVTVAIPVMYLLGRNDPYVHWAHRKSALEKSDRFLVSVITYDDEGHWFRKSHNIQTSIETILSHYQSVRD